MGFNHFTKSLGELTLGSKHNELIKKILPNSIKLGSITQEKEILVTDKTGKNINFENLGWDSL